MNEPLATHDHQPGDLETSLRFVKRTWAELRELRRVCVWPDRIRIIDVNKDCFEVRNLGYADPDVVPVLRIVNAAFDPETVHEPTGAEYKEFGTGRRFPWAHDRAM